MGRGNINKNALIHKMRLELGERMGIIVPVIQLRDNITLGEKEYRILLHGREVEAPIRSEYPLYFYAREDALPTAEWRTVWLQGEWQERQETVPEGYVEISAMECIVMLLSETILRHYDQILNRQLTADLVDMTRRRYPAAVEGIVPQQVSLSLLQQVLAGLVAANVPVNRLDYIIGYLEEHPVSPDNGMDNILAALGEVLR